MDDSNLGGKEKLGMDWEQRGRTPCRGTYVCVLFFCINCKINVILTLIC